MVAKQDYIGKWALILGGSSGLGLATAQKLGKEGMHICIVHRTRRSAIAAFEAAFAAMEEAGIVCEQHNIDALNSEKRSNLITRLQENIGKGSFKTLVHSIARGNLKPLYSEEERVMTHKDFELTIDAMALSLYDWVNALAKAGMFSSDARIIAFTSEGSSRSWPQYAAVGAAKAALESITRGMALELAPLGIKANCIQAGVTDTESLRMIPGSKLMKDTSIDRNPYNRLTTPADVANAVFLLCRDEAIWINGTVIPVDGGEHIR